MGDPIPQYPRRKDGRDKWRQEEFRLVTPAPQFDEHYSYATEKLLKQIRDELRALNTSINKLVTILDWRPK